MYPKMSNYYIKIHLKFWICVCPHFSQIWGKFSNSLKMHSFVQEHAIEFYSQNQFFLSELIFVVHHQNQTVGFYYVLYSSQFGYQNYKEISIGFTLSFGINYITNDFHNTNYSLHLSINIYPLSFPSRSSPKYRFKAYSTDLNLGYCLKLDIYSKVGLSHNNKWS